MANLVVELGKLSVSHGVKSVYGEPQDLGGVQLLPVAIAWSGFGGGSDDGEQRDGGGGGGFAVPVGAYIRRGEDVRFAPNVVAMLAVGIPFVWVVGRAVRSVVRTLKK